MSEVKTPTLSMSESAIKALKELIVTEGLSEDKVLRVGVKGGGCSGLTYILDFDEQKEFDEVYYFDGLKVVADQRHLIYLMGTEVDYEYGLNDRGFVFRNPNASETCGCGTSFKTD